MQNDVMAMAAVQLGIPKRIVYVKNTNLEILNKRLTDEGKEETKDYNEVPSRWYRLLVKFIFRNLIKKR